MSLRTNLAVIVAAVLLAGCGDEAADPSGAPAAGPSATPTPAPAPVDEGGDEEGNRPGLHFDLLPGSVAPDRVEVPAFLGLRIRLRNQTGRRRTVRLEGEPLAVLEPGDARTVDAEGLRPGKHTLRAGRSGRAVIVAVRAGG